MPEPAGEIAAHGAALHYNRPDKSQIFALRLISQSCEYFLDPIEQAFHRGDVLLEEILRFFLLNIVAPALVMAVFLRHGDHVAGHFVAVDHVLRVAEIIHRQLMVARPAL